MEDIEFSKPMTIRRFKRMLAEKTVPEDAVIEYAGCGSHAILIRDISPNEMDDTDHILVEDI